MGDRRDRRGPRQSALSSSENKNPAPEAVPALFFPVGPPTGDPTEDSKLQQEAEVLMEWQESYVTKHIAAGHAGICYAWLDNAFCPLNFSTGR